MLTLALFVIIVAEIMIISRRYYEVTGNSFASFEEFITKARPEDIFFVHHHASIAMMTIFAITIWSGGVR